MTISIEVSSFIAAAAKKKTRMQFKACSIQYVLTYLWIIIIWE